MQVGFVGLGQMGRPIARNLMSGDDHLVVSSRGDAWKAEFTAEGAEAASEPAGVAAAEVIFLCLPGTAAVEAVLLGAGGLVEHLRPGQIVVDLSTIAYAATLDISAALTAKGVVFLDAPISGMEARAIDGTLTVMCGGDRSIFQRLQPLLDRIGSTVLFMGPTGSGQLTKLINQLLFDVNAAALAEILPMAVKMGLDPDLVGAVVNSGTARSYASEFFIPRILQGHFADGYPMSHAYKDLVSAAEVCVRAGIPTPVLAAATATYQTALLRGHGDKDKGGMVRVFEELLGVEYRSRRDDSDDDGKGLA